MANTISSSSGGYNSNSLGKSCATCKHSRVYTKKPCIFVSKCGNLSKWEKFEKACTNCKFSFKNFGSQGCMDNRNSKIVCHDEKEWQLFEPKPEPKTAKDFWDKGYKCKQCSNYKNDFGCMAEPHWTARDGEGSINKCREFKLIKRSCDTCKYKKENGGTGCPPDATAPNHYNQVYGCGHDKNVGHYAWKSIEPKPIKKKEPKIKKYCSNCKFFNARDCLPKGKPYCDSDTGKHKWISKDVKEEPIPIKKKEPKPEIKKGCKVCEFSILNKNNITSKCPALKGNNGRCIKPEFLLWKPIGYKPEIKKTCNNCKNCSANNGTGVGCWSIVGSESCDKAQGFPKWQAIEPKVNKIPQHILDAPLPKETEHFIKGTWSDIFTPEPIYKCDGEHKPIGFAQIGEPFKFKNDSKIVFKNKTKIKKEKEVVKNMIDHNGHVINKITEKAKLEREIDELRKVVKKEQKIIDKIIVRFKNSKLTDFYKKDVAKHYPQDIHYFYYVYRDFITYIKDYKEVSKVKIKEMKKIRFDEKAHDYKEGIIEPLRNVLSLIDKYAKDYEIFKLKKKLCSMKKDCYKDLTKPACPDCKTELRKGSNYCDSCGAQIDTIRPRVSERIRVGRTIRGI